MKELKLKPCPFCGGKAEIVSMSEKFTVSCASGGCMANIAWCPDEEKAAQAWNARTLGWIPCSDRMPDSPIRCAVITENGGCGVSRYCGRNTIEWSLLGKIVTHWMPLPPLPEVNYNVDKTDR